MNMEIREIKEERAKQLILEYHYMKYLPQLNDKFLGGFIDGELAAVMTLGWGVRPRHTIEKLFESLGVEDYRSIGRLACVEELPKNTESHFISKCVKYIQRNYDWKMLFTWADGFLGKPGIIYQASNFYYGGYIWTDAYLTENGERVHPRQTNRIGGRPSFEGLQELGWDHYRGMQLRYVWPLCDSEAWGELREQSEYNWTQQEYPKEQDLEWKVKTNSGWEKTTKPEFESEELAFNEKHGKQLEAHEEQHSLGSFNTGQETRFDRYVVTESMERFEK